MCPRSFDLLHVMVDDTTEVQDEAIAGHILAVHRCADHAPAAAMFPPLAQCSWGPPATRAMSHSVFAMLHKPYWHASSSQASSGSVR